MRISIIGTGYVGLVSGVCLAEKGNTVICVDIDREKVKKINNSVSPIYETGLEELLRKNINKRFKATTNLHQSVMETEISLIAVETPFNGAEIDLTSIRRATGQIAEVLKNKPGYHTVVVKSTVVPGTTDKTLLPIIEEVSKKKAGPDFGLGMNPEFLREGSAVKDFIFPDRIVLGGIDRKSISSYEKMYSGFGGVDVLRTNNTTAEMIKYTSNSLLATLISYSNEIGNLCAAIEGVDVLDVMRGVHLDQRISPILEDGTRVTPQLSTYLRAGCGFGGSCFPKDVKAIIAHGKQYGMPMKLLHAVMEINERQPRQLIKMLDRHFDPFEPIDVAVLGLAFKPGTNDMRESPAIPVINALLDRNASIRAYDPAASEDAARMFGNKGIEFYDNLKQAIDDVHAIFVITHWDEFDDLHQLINEMPSQPLVVDGRRMLNKDRLERYAGIGL